MNRIIYDELFNRIDATKSIISSAEDCLLDNQFVQCAARLEELKKLCNFTEFEYSILNEADKCAE